MARFAFSFSAWARSFAMLASVATVATCACITTGCDKPYLAHDGTLIFPERGGGGASVLTANGVEYRDSDDIPSRVVTRTPYEPWRAPVGFIVPADGRFERTSQPTTIASKDLDIVLRPSDTRVPSWGGEVLVRVDIIAPAAEKDARFGEDIALVVDASQAHTLPVVAAALERLSARDRITVIDAHGAHVVVPKMPASDRALVLGAVARRFQTSRPREDVTQAITLAENELTQGASSAKKRLVLVVDESSQNGVNYVDSSVLERAGARGIVMSAVRGDALDAVAQITAVLPASGDVAFTNIKIAFEGIPAPSHVIEASGGEVYWRLDAGEVWLADLRAGESRTEVLRVSVPAWLPNSPFTFSVRAHAENAKTGGVLDVPAELACIYDDDIGRIAKSRHGDVIAYASALATLKQLDLSFNAYGAVSQPSLRSLALLQVRSMATLAYENHDPAMRHQADMLSALLAASN